MDKIHNLSKENQRKIKEAYLSLLFLEIKLHETLCQRISSGYSVEYIQHKIDKTEKLREKIKEIYL